MKIEWNKVTWYSWVASAVVFGGAFAFGIFVGMHLQYADDLKTPVKMGQEQTITMHRPTSVTPAKVPTTTTVTYSCDSGKKIQAAYMDGKVHITTSDGKDLILPQALSADGGRYANSNESFVFWSKGTGAFVMQSVAGISTTTYANCTQIAAPIQ